MRTFILALLCHGMGQCALLVVPANAYTLRYKVAEPDHAEILSRLESSTGLQFSAKCPEVRKKDAPACAVHGNLKTGQGYVVVEVYQSALKADRRSKAVKVDTVLRKKIGRAVLNLPPPTPPVK